MFFVELQELRRSFDRFLLRRHFVYGVGTDQLFGFGERPVGDSQFPCRKTNPSRGVGLGFP